MHLSSVRDYGLCAWVFVGPALDRGFCALVDGLCTVGLGLAFERSGVDIVIARCTGLEKLLELSPTVGGESVWISGAAAVGGLQTAGFHLSDGSVGST